MDKKEFPITVEKIEQLIRVLSPLPEAWVVVVAVAAILSAFEVTLTEKGGVAIAFRLTAITVTLIGLVWLPFLLRLIALTGGGLKTAAGEASMGGLLELLRNLDPNVQQETLPTLIAALDAAESKADTALRPQVREMRQGLEGQLSSLAPDVGAARLALEQCATEYETLRRTLDSGDERTQKMSAVVARVRSLAGQANQSVDEVKQMFNSGSDGKRIVALGVMRRMLEPAALDIVLSAIGQPRSPFEQYHALRAAEEMTPALDADQKRQLKAVLDDQRRPDKWLTPVNWDRWTISNRILNAIQAGSAPG